MQTFKEFLETNHSDALDEGWRDWAKPALVGATMLGAGMGMAGNSQAGQSVTSPAAQSFAQPQPGNTLDANYHYNSEIGRYSVGPNGVYQAKKGNFKRVADPSHPSGFKFVNAR